MKFARSQFVFPVMTTTLLAAAVALALAQTDGLKQKPIAPQTKTQEKSLQKKAPTKEHLAHAPTGFSFAPAFMTQTGREVTIVLSQASAQEVMDALREADINFVIDVSDLPQDKKYSLNLVKVDETNAISAVAQVMGLMPSQNDNVFTLSKRPLMMAPFAGDLDHMAPFEHDFEFAPGSPFRIFDHDSMTPEQKAMFEKAMKEFETQMDNFEFQFDDKSFKMFNELDDVFESEEFAKQMEEFGKRMEELGKDFDRKELLLGKEELEAIMKLKNIDKSVIERAMKLKTENIQKIMESLTTEQRELAKKQGFLKYSDLTEEQQKLLGDVDPDGEFEFSVKGDKDELKIKKAK